MARLTEYMFSLNGALAAALLLGCYTVVSTILSYRKLSHFAGPPLASVTRAWLFWQSITGQLPTAEHAALLKYGSPLVRIGSDLLVTDDAEIIRHMSAPRSQWRRSGWHEGMRLDARRDNVFSTRDEAIHADLRSKMIGGYQGRDIDSLEPDIDARIGDFVGLIKNTYDRKSFDITKQAQYFTLDVLSTVAFGAPFGFLKANAVSSAPQLALVSIKSQDAECQISQVVLADTFKDIYDLAKANAQFQPIIALITEHSILRWLFLNPIVRKLTSPKETDLVGLGPIVKAARNAVGERFGPDAKEKRDMLGHFRKKGLDQLQCEAEANLQILAGSDSTTTILRCLLFMLTATPAAYANLRNEIDTAVAEGNLSFPVATYAETQKLSYLGVCILEGIRMYPPLVGLKGKLSPRGGDTINGQYIPEGTEVAVCDIAMCRKKEIFGEDSHIFRPDRWVEADAQTRQRYQNVVDSVFGGGKWTCLGKHIAMLELHKVFTELFRNFDWAFTDPMQSVPCVTHGIHMMSDMNMIPYSRER